MGPRLTGFEVRDRNVRRSRFNAAFTTAFGLLACTGPARPSAGAEPPAQAADSGGVETLKQFAGDGFRFRETDHFVIAYDTSYDALRPLIGRLEGTFNAILGFAGRAQVGRKDGLDRLPVLLFDDYDAFTRYAAESGLRGSMAGFYHHRTNIAAFCNTAHLPELRRLANELERARRRMQQISAAGGGSPAAIQTGQDLQRTIATLQTQSDAVSRTFNRFVIQHEAAHQVLFNLGVHVREADNPVWLVEGLACQFEVPQSGHDGLLKRVNHMRLADFRDALRVEPGVAKVSDEAYRRAVAEGRFLPLAKLIVDPDALSGDGGNTVFHYAQAWALVFYLHQEYREAFAGYLRRLGERRRGEFLEKDRLVDEFREAFGEPDAAFERRWIDRVLGIRLDASEAGR